MIDPGNLGQFADAARSGDDLFKRHARIVATGNPMMQAEKLPTATASNPTFRHVADMAKRGDPMIGRRVREGRARLELSQEELADRSGVSRSHIAGIETAQRTAGRQTLMNLARCFRVPVDYFTNRDELLATAMWVLGRLPPDELQAWVDLMMARATRDRLPPRD